MGLPQIINQESHMETKRNLKYYTAPPISIPTIVGLVITLVGVILALVLQSKIPGIAVIVLGLLVVMFTTGGKSNDTDIEFQARALTSDLHENSMKKFEVYEKHFLKMLRPIDLAGYDFEAAEPEFYYKKGQDGTPRTNYFKAFNLIFTSERIYIYGRRLSLTNEEINETITGQYKYNQLSKAEVLEKQFKTPKGDEITYHVFKIYDADGNAILDTCIDYGADSDKAVENINRAIEVRRVEIEKRAEERAVKLREFREKVMAGEITDLPQDSLDN